MGEDVRWTDMVSLRQALGARDLSRSNHPGRDMGWTFLEGRIVKGSETEPIHCVEEKKVSLLGHKKADGIRPEGKEGFKGKLSYTVDHCKEYGFNMKSDGKPVEGFEKKTQIWFTFLNSCCCKKSFMRVGSGLGTLIRFCFIIPN